MRIIVIVLFMLSSGCVPSTLNTVPVSPAKAAQLAAVRTLYLDGLGNEDGADLVREKIRARLIASNRFIVVENPQQAEAVLVGVAGVEKSISEGETHYRGMGIFRIVERSTDSTIWSYEYKRGFMLFGSVSSRVADQVVDRLLLDAGP